MYYCIRYRLLCSERKTKLLNHAQYKLKNLVSLRFLILGLMVFPPFSQAILTATTINAIHGTAPYFVLSDNQTKLTNLYELIGFKMPKQNGNVGFEQIDMTKSARAITAPAGMKYKDVLALVVADGELHNIDPSNILDDDGDANIANSAYANGQLRATWYDGGVKVTNLDQTLDDCGGPYTLKIDAPSEVSANTKYGLPSSNIYGSNSGVTYTFAPANQHICYVQPGDMTVNKGTATDSKFTEGYNPSIWVDNKGFKASAGFPTTGFEKAVFNLVGPGNDQSKYRCTSTDNGGKISLSGASSKDIGENCKITYNSKTKAAFTSGGTPTITMEYYVGEGKWNKIGEYKIAQPIHWPIIVGDSLGYANYPDFKDSTNFESLDACRLAITGSNTPKTTKDQATSLTEDGKKWRQTYLYRRNELTNTPFTDPIKYPEGQATTSAGNFSRDVDGTFMGEWGTLYNYAGSGWSVNPYLWTAEMSTTQRQYLITYPGGVNHEAVLISGMTAACRGD